MEARSSRFLDPNIVPLKQRADGNIWARLVHLTKWLLVAGVVILLLALYLPPYQEANRYKNQIDAYQHQIAILKDRNEELSQTLELLKTNPDYVQRIARDKLNLGRPGEMIFRFDPYPPSDHQQATNK